MFAPNLDQINFANILLIFQNLEECELFFLRQHIANNLHEEMGAVELQSDHDQHIYLEYSPVDNMRDKDEFPSEIF